MMMQRYVEGGARVYDIIAYMIMLCIHWWFAKLEAIVLL